MENNHPNKSETKYMFTALGIIFGSAIGAGLSLVITGNVIWGLVGTAAGLIVGAAIDSSKKKNP